MSANDIVKIIESCYHSTFRVLSENSKRSIDQALRAPQTEQKWKKMFWERSSVEPAMLRVPLVAILFLFLWGVNVWSLDKMRIPYQPVLKVSTPNYMIMATAAVLLTVYTINMSFMTTILGGSVEVGISLFYVLLGLLAILPLPGYETRSIFFRLVKIVFFPGNNITFPEVLLADALTSISKLFKDLCVTAFVVFCHFANDNIIHYHDIGIVSIALLSSLPYWIRVRQCWVQLLGQPDGWSRFPVVLNMLKYCSAFPPIWLAASQGLGYHHDHLPTIIAIAATINSIYSFGWDVVMDWGLVTITRTQQVFFRQRSSFSWLFYALLIAVNLALRFSWRANRLPWLSSLPASSLVLVLEVLEVFRRALWNVVRIEWEVIVQQDKLGMKELGSEKDWDRESREKDKGITSKTKG